MSARTVAFSNGGRSVSFEFDCVDDVAGLQRVVSRFLGVGDGEVSGLVQSWDSGVRKCGRILSESSGVESVCGAVCASGVGYRCVSGGAVHSGRGVGSVAVLVDSLGDAGSSVVGSGVGEPGVEEGASVESGQVKSKNARKKASQRARRAAAKAMVERAGVSEGCRGAGVADVEPCSGKESYSFRDVTTKEEQRVFARQWFERKSVENELAIQRGRYNVKHNDYMLSSRVAEKKWECDRLRCEEKLANINRIRFGSKPGYAETLASLSDGSEKPPSLSTGSDSPANLSDGTISPNSSMSVAEECKLRKKLEEMSEEVAQLKLERAALTTSRACSGGKVVVEDGRIHVYDGTGQYVPPTPVYGSECALSMGDYPEELQRHCDFVY